MASIQKVKDVVVNYFNFCVFYLCFRRGYIPHFLFNNAVGDNNDLTSL